MIFLELEKYEVDLIFFSSHGKPSIPVNFTESEQDSSLYQILWNTTVKWKSELIWKGKGFMDQIISLQNFCLFLSFKKEVQGEQKSCTKQSVKCWLPPTCLIPIDLGWGRQQQATHSWIGDWDRLSHLFSVKIYLILADRELWKYFLGL